ncbi:MAG: hypothetical protein H6838_19760 [Planctomycetes bacterium]|nr:hypothetical protein [Planctomycetota bacterium]
MKSWLVILTVAAGAVLSLPAQAVLGQAAPPLPGLTWQRGAPVVPGDAAAPRATVFAFYDTPHAAGAMVGDGAHLATLQRDLAERGVRVVAVVGRDETDAPRLPDEDWSPCSVAVDTTGATATWLGDELGRNWNVVVVDGLGRVAFLGRPGAGLADAVQATLSGAADLAAEQHAFALRRLVSFDDVAFERVRDELEAASAYAPHDGVLAGMRYALFAHHGDRAAARAALDRDLPKLVHDGAALAWFADLALRADAAAPNLAATLCEPLAAAVAAAPRDVALGLANLRALVLAQRGRDVGRQVMRVRKLALADAEACLQFAEILAQAEQPAIYADLANQALQRAAALEASPRLLAATRFVVARRCAADDRAAQNVLAEYLERLQLRVSINNDCWYFLTELPTMGRYDVFAAALADRMLEQKEAMDYFEFDTAALAMFRAGRLADAVELQQQAIDKGGKDDPAYRGRLSRYKAAVAAAPR